MAAPETESFEKEWAAFMGAKSAVAVTSGTAALITCLKAMGIGPGDSVLVPTYTYIATPLAVTAVGAIPIYTEIDETLTMCPKDAARKMRQAHGMHHSRSYAGHALQHAGAPEGGEGEAVPAF